MNFSISKKNFSSFLSPSNVIISNNIKIYYNLNKNKKIGFIVPKSFGSAPKRNLFKRRCRYIFLNHNFFKQYNFAIIIKPMHSKNFNYNSLFISFSNFLTNNTL